MKVLPSPSAVYAALLPHAPVLVPPVAQRRLPEISHTVDAMREVAAEVVRFRPTVLVLVSPHAPRYPDAFALWDAPRIHGSLASFGHDRERVDLPVDQVLVVRLAAAAGARGLATETMRAADLDHGSVVPLWFLAEAGWKGPTVVLGLPENGNLVPRLGEALHAAFSSTSGRIAIVASGDMSHRLTQNAPCGYHPAGARFDATFIDLLRAGDFEGVGHLDPGLLGKAAEDATESTLVALAASGFDAEGHRVLSYQGPFGVGYGVAVLHSPGPKPAGVPGGEGSETLDSTPPPGYGDLPGFARLAVSQRLGRVADVSWPMPLDGPLAERHPVFVTIHDADDDLRGCVGSLEAREDNLIQETRRFAIAAAFNDHRFPQVQARELSGLRFSVTVLGPLEDVPNTEHLDPAVYGVSVETSDGRNAVLLPAIPGITTVDQQLSVVRRKAGIEPGEPIRIRRFRADCHEESIPSVHATLSKEY